MSQRNDDAPQAPEPQRSDFQDTGSNTDSEQDTYDDALDDSAARSLTGRKPSAQQRQSPSADNSSPTSVEHASDDNEKPPLQEQPRGQDDNRQSTQSHTVSDTDNLDTVNLDDDAVAPQKEGSPSIPYPQDDLRPAVTDRHAADDASKGHVPKESSSRALSITGFTNSLPSMPWSPNAESPGKSPIPSPSALAAAPAPPTRKLTSPFAWLSRNSGAKEKESTSPPALSSPRRNTASSVATLTSNPEMMLSRLDEEAVGGAGNPNSLKDRFKMVRMREETGATVPTGEDDSPSAATNPPARSGASVTSNDSGDVEKSLAPGTASGVSAGPSALAESDVDWDLWQAVVYEGPAAVARSSADELNRAIATGIPSAIRGVVWQVLAQSKNEELERVYADLVARGTDKQKDRNSNSTSASATTNGSLAVQSDAVPSSASSIRSDRSASNGPHPTKSASDKASEADRKQKEKEDAAALQKLEKTIRRDLGQRTSFSKYAAAAGLQEGLFGICKAYALYDEGVGYAQGMNFLIMPLLFNMPEEEAFCLLTRLMDHYHLRDLFIHDMPGLHLHLYQFERLLEDLEPALYCHLRRRAVSPHLYATQWFLTLFAYRFPLQLVLRIYDLILSDGLSAILRFGLVLMQKNAAALLAISDMQQLTTFLKDKLFDVYIDKDPSAGSILENGFFGSSSSSMEKEVYRADQLVRDACEVKITPEVLKTYAAEWEEKTKTEKDREAELENLRTTSSSLAIKVRRLEERLETCDGEQAAMATELVHTKVENEELKDENESLRGQVRELRVVIEQQPEELEGKWALEREDLMKRNKNVHDENQRLEQELTTLEEQLVQTKMQYAELNSQHETLTRRWTELKRQFD
ncbi:related to GTPase-activating protein (GAP) [Cephalotrichum gorgonifer]|uniref:GTPase-activating protein GYP5 n=1 Tax=Cephalotrichum gorgonifer TaxID=2041049 RepID=A0AAE8SWY2_9PEZI|nr:related to GTPase-activating protein (GAP) [Cephalotrichum gorgonifer]